MNKDKPEKKDYRVINVLMSLKTDPPKVRILTVSRM